MVNDKFHVYVEGGGDKAKDLKTAFREGFSIFLEKAAIDKKDVQFVVCGSRTKAYDMFRIAITQGKKALLLVDSETPVAPEHMTGAPERWQPWKHLWQQKEDRWKRPAASSDMDCHLMAQTTESWFLADKSTVEGFFGRGFRESALPKHSSIEAIGKLDVLQGLKNATHNCKPEFQYKKGTHAPKLLKRIDPGRVCAASPWAKRFVETVRARIATS